MEIITEAVSEQIVPAQIESEEVVKGTEAPPSLHAETEELMQAMGGAACALTDYAVIGSENISMSPNGGGRIDVTWTVPATIDTLVEVCEAMLAAEDALFESGFDSRRVYEPRQVILAKCKDIITQCEQGRAYGWREAEKVMAGIRDANPALIAQNVARYIAEKYGPVNVSGIVGADGKFQLEWIAIPGGRMRVLAVGYPERDSRWVVVNENDDGDQVLNHEIKCDGDALEIATNLIEFIEAYRLVYPENDHN
jgi:hypothetical protein